jgi:glutathione S-transferase
VLELDDGTCFAESNGILCYLADGTPYLPGERLARAQVLQWLFFEQYSHEPNIATPRYWLRHLEMTPERQVRLVEKQKLGRDALAVMERHLDGRDWFAAGRYTVADIALYAYTHVADQGGFDLAPYPRVRAWLGRVTAEPGHVPMF